MKRNDEWAEAMTVECPRCMAAVGVPCVTANGDVVTNGPHTGRFFSARGQPVSERWKAQPPKPPKAPSRLAQEMALADDLMDVLARMVVGWEHIIGADLAQHPDVLRVSARYQEARGR